MEYQSGHCSTRSWPVPAGRLQCLMVWSSCHVVMVDITFCYLLHGHGHGSLLWCFLMSIRFLAIRSGWNPEIWLLLSGEGGKVYGRKSSVLHDSDHAPCGPEYTHKISWSRCYKVNVPSLAILQLTQWKEITKFSGFHMHFRLFRDSTWNDISKIFNGQVPDRWNTKWEGAHVDLQSKMS